MKKVLVTVAVVFAVSLAIVIGKRMSTEAISIVVGIVCGVATSILMSLLITWLVQRHGEREKSYPNVIIMSRGDVRRYTSQPLSQAVEPLRFPPEKRPRARIIGSHPVDVSVQADDVER